jgi:hypothetical protein
MWSPLPPDGQPTEASGPCDWSGHLTPFCVGDADDHYNSVGQHRATISYGERTRTAPDPWPVVAVRSCVRNPWTTPHFGGQPRAFCGHPVDGKKDRKSVGSRPCVVRHQALDITHPQGRTAGREAAPRPQVRRTALGLVGAQELRKQGRARPAEVASATHGRFGASVQQERRRAVREPRGLSLRSSSAGGTPERQRQRVGRPAGRR